MTTGWRGLTGVVLGFVLAVPTSGAAQPQPQAPPAPPLAGQAAPPPGPVAEGTAAERTPPRLSFTYGDVSFWRPGAGDWTPAQINMPLAPGDALYTAPGASVELQIGPHAYLRAAAGTQLSLANQEPDFMQFSVTAGHVSVDLRGHQQGHTVEIDTPNAAFSIDATGYYRVDVTDDTTAFITRRGGRAMVSPAGGEGSAVAPSEEVIVQGTSNPTVATYVAPELDAWDRWNYARTDQLIDAVSTRYVSSGMYGVDGLDHYGSWRVVSSYGPVWIPSGVAPGWAPYTIGRWVWDPYYGWTWVDTAPWGWAPYHYGRWVSTGGYWGWAPGPLVVRPVYAPALVAFFGGSGFGVSIGISGPAVGWCALGWGEPVVPWWGPHVGTAWWGGWGGPHVVNNTVINHTTVVNVTNINYYQNAHGGNGVVAVPTDHFGRGGFRPVSIHNFDPHQLQPVHGRLDIRPVAASLTPATGHGRRPPEQIANRPVVATRAPHDPAATLRPEGVEVHHAAPAARLVTAPSAPHSAVLGPRPPFGQQGTAERPRPPLPPRFQASRQPGQTQMPSRYAPAERVHGPAVERQPATAPPVHGPAPDVRAPSRRPAPAPVAAAPPAMQRREQTSLPAPQVHAPAGPPAFEPRRPEPVAPQPRPQMRAPSGPHGLPGEPANRLYRGSAPAMHEPRSRVMVPDRGGGDAAPRGRRDTSR